jgi:hypothetical protein
MKLYPLFKAMVLRLYESGYINDSYAEEFLEISTEEIEQQFSKQKGIGYKWFKKNETKQYSNLLDLAQQNFDLAAVSSHKSLSQFKKVNMEEEIIDVLRT